MREWNIIGAEKKSSFVTKPSPRSHMSLGCDSSSGSTLICHEIHWCCSDEYYDTHQVVISNLIRTDPCHAKADYPSGIKHAFSWLTWILHRMMYSKSNSEYPFCIPKRKIWVLGEKAGLRHEPADVYRRLKLSTTCFHFSGGLIATLFLQSSPRHSYPHWVVVQGHNTTIYD